MRQQGGLSWQDAVNAAYGPAPQGGMSWEEAVASVYGPPPDPTIGDRFASLGQSVSGGLQDFAGLALRNMGGVASWLQETTGIGEPPHTLSETGEALGASAQQAHQRAQALAPDQPTINKFGAALGSAVPLAGASLLTGGTAALLGTGARGVAAVAGATAGIGGALAQGQADFERALAGGATPEEARAAGMIGAAFGATEGLPIWSATRRLVKATGMSIERAAGIVMASALENAAQEATVGVGSNLAQKVTHNPEQSLTEGVGEQAGLGAVVGAIGGGVGAVAGRALGRPQGDAAPAPEGGEPQPASVQPEPSQEAVERTRIEEPDEAVSAGLERLSAANEGRAIHAVEPTTDEDAFAQEFLGQRGARTVQVQAEDGQPLRTPGMFDPESGIVYEDVNQPTKVLRMATLTHEVVHVAEDKAPEALAALVEELKVADPEGFQLAERHVLSHSPGLDPDALRSESTARYAESISNWIQGAMRDPQRFAAVLAEAPTLRERLRDGLKAILEKVGIKLDSSLQKRMQGLIDELGLEPSADPEVSLRMARRFAEVMDGLATANYEQPSPQSATTGLAAEAEVEGKIPVVRQSSGPEGAVTGEQPKLGQSGTAPSDLAAMERPALQGLMERQLAAEEATAREVLGAELGYDEARVHAFIETRRRARDVGGLEQPKAAKAILAIKERLSDEGMSRLFEKTETGYATEDIGRALALKREEYRRPSKKTLKRKGPENQEAIAEHKERLGKDPRFSVREHPERATGSIAEKAKAFVSDPLGKKELVGKRGPQQGDLPPMETRVQAFQRLFQQRLIRPITLGKARNVPADWTQSEEAMPSKAKHAIDKIEANVARPIRAILDKHKIELWEAGRYVYALHAPDANALAHKRHPKKFGLQSNPGSGMSNAEAKGILEAAHKDARAAGFKEIGALMQSLEQSKRAGMVSAGRLSQEGSAFWAKELGPHYITLRDAETTPEFERISQRRGVALPKRREGRLSKAAYDKIIPHTIALAADSAIQNAENDVRVLIGQWIRDLKDPNVAEIVAEDRLDENDQIQPVSPRSPPPLKPGESLLRWREKANDGSVHDVFAIIRDAGTARAILRTGIVHGGPVMRALMSVTHVLKMLRTNWSPEFFLTNPQSDVGDALIVIQREGKNLGRKILRGLPKAFQATWNAEHGTGKRTAWSGYYDDARADGVPTGFYDYKSVEDRAQELQSSFDASKGALLTRQAFNYIDAVNSSLENMTRLSVYVTMREAGASRKDAARAARETTTPFMRRGELAGPLGIAYLFFNARVQGAALVVNAIKSPRVQRALGLLVAYSFAQALANRMILGQDEEGEDIWDKRRAHEKYQNILVAIPGLSTPLKARAPRMFIPFWMLGVGAADILAGDLKPSQFAKDLFTAVVDGFSPLDTSHDPLQAATPTVLKPYIEARTNTGPFGQKLNPEIPGDRRPGSEQAWPETSPLARSISDLINSATGGDKVTEGAVSPRPGSVENFLKFVAGGTGTFGVRAYDSTQRLLNGEPLLVGETPLLRRIVSDESPRHTESQYRASIRAIDDMIYRSEAYAKQGEREKAQDVREEEPRLWSLRLQARAYEKRIDAMRDRLKVLPEDSPARERIEENIEEAMAAFLRLVRGAR